MSLLFDFPNELLDAGRGRQRLFPLQLRRRPLALLVGKVDADDACGQNGTADKKHENDEIFAEEVAVEPGQMQGRQRSHGSSQSGNRRYSHSVTPSATEGGMVMFSRRWAAVLTTKSNCDDCSIGRSPGLAPRRILST